MKILIIMKAVILAGGYGKRFWPKSRKNIPKQCLPITSKESMILETSKRICKITPEKNICISTGKHLSKSLKKIVPNLNYIVEPCARNTAACIGLSAIHHNEEDIIFIETSDHTYSDVDEYIKQGKLIKQINNVKLYEIEEFREKPSLDVAEEFLKNGNYLWNSGMFLFKVRVLLEEIEKYMPELYCSLMKIKNFDFDEKVLE